MSLEQLRAYWPILLVFGFFTWKFFRFRRIKSQIPALLEKGAVVIDVRSREEFQSGSNPKSVNIPLSEIDKQANKLDKAKPIILCCASGARSGMAASSLRRLGFNNVINAGPWSNTLPGKF